MVALGPAFSTPSPSSGNSRPCWTARRTSATKRSISAAAAASPMPAAVSSDCNTPSSRLSSSEKSTLLPGSLTMKAPICGMTSRRCDSRYCAMIRINICLWFQASKLPFFEEKTKTRHTLFQNSDSEKRKKRGESGPAGPDKRIAERPCPGQTTGHAPVRHCRRHPPRTPADRKNSASDGAPDKNRTSHPTGRETKRSARRPAGKTAGPTTGRDKTRRRRRRNATKHTAGIK